MRHKEHVDLAELLDIRQRTLRTRNMVALDKAVKDADHAAKQYSKAERKVDLSAAAQLRPASPPMSASAYAALASSAGTPPLDDAEDELAALLTAPTVGAFGRAAVSAAAGSPAHSDLPVPPPLPPSPRGRSSTAGSDDTDV